MCTQLSGYQLFKNLIFDILNNELFSVDVTVVINMNFQFLCTFTIVDTKKLNT